MAIYSLNLKSIGRTTHAPGTAGAHLLYISRPEAEPEMFAEHMPLDANEARAWMSRAENDDRKNARVVDKVRLALPRELTPEQRMQLVRDFAQALTGGRVPWFAAIHAQGKDAYNPHCHFVIRDRDIDTGKRVLRLSDSPRDRANAGLEPKAVEWVRAAWELYANRALERAGHDARIDRRTLEAQGIDREATIHIGPQAALVEQFVDRPRSKIVETGNGRTIDYPQIDEGRTRKERHAEIVDFNLEKEARSPDYRTRETAKLQREQAKLDRQLEAALIAKARALTHQFRQIRAEYRDEISALRADYRAEADALKAIFKRDWATGRKTMTERHSSEREALSSEQGRIKARVLRLFDLTGRTRRHQDEARRQMQEQHRQERAALVSSHRALKERQVESLRDRRSNERRGVKATYAPGFGELAEKYRRAELDADRQRQMRAIDRERAEQKTESAIGRVEQLYRARQASRQQDRGRGFEIG